MAGPEGTILNAATSRTWAEIDLSAIRHNVRTLKAGERRDNDEVQARLDDVRAAARGTQNLLHPMRDALKAKATLGEVSDALREEFGVYQPTR